MVQLFMIRHGLAGNSLEDEAMDEERPLTKKGKEKMKEIAKGMKKMKMHFDIVLTSPLLRSRETAEIIHAYCGRNEEPMVTELLSPYSSYKSLIRLLNKHKESSSLALIGHEPFLSGFASYCLSNNDNSFLCLKKGGALMLEIDRTIKPGNCLLTWLMEPKQIIQCNA
ncbi:MAG: phosphohistidine phosphatase SixA [Parachlamydiaceae bacterium]|nr:phosphohistidine phosphatase SixA [Parachlamydiaceae bacterium]